MSFDPKKAECVSLYLYGSGYYAREDQQLAIVRGQTASSFCNECPVKPRCWELHKDRTAELLPAEMEQFERECQEAARRNIGPALVAAVRQRAGRPDPYMRVALENFKRGTADRESASEEAGTT